ncbi:MAG: hypothetical protein ACLFVT_08075 [Syntrophobacteria bacterium]
MSWALGKALRKVPEESRQAARSVARDLLGESGYRELLADLEKHHGKVADRGHLTMLSPAR